MLDAPGPEARASGYVPLPLRGLYDPSQPLKPWLFKLALNRIRNFRRGSAARVERERVASRNEGTSLEGDPVEDEDLKVCIHKALARVPEPDKALIVLHYYSGLSHGEIGAAMSLPRTTVQSRLEKALQRLKRALVGLGCAVPLSSVEAALRATPPMAVPVELAASLSTIPASMGALGGGVGLPTILGGMIMTKKLVAAVATALACMLFIGGAYSTGKWQGKCDMEGVVAASEKVATTRRQQHEELLAQHQKLSREVEALRLRLKEQGDALSRARGVTAAAVETSVDAAKAAGAASEPEIALDWKKLSVLFASRLDLLYDFATAEGATHRQPTKEEKLVLAELEGTLMEVFAKARQLSDDPFYDKRVLTGLCEAMCIPSLGLSPEKEKEVRSALEKIFSEKVEGFDPDASLPSEAFRVRQEFLRMLDESVGASLDEAAAERWEKLRALARKLLEGDRALEALPTVPDDGNESRSSGVLKRWKDAFSLTESQSTQFEPLASDFIAAADAILARYGQMGDTPRKLSAAEKAKLNAELLDVQIEKERQLLEYLSPQQREALRGRSPTIIQFAPGNKHWADHRRGSPL